MTANCEICFGRLRKEAYPIFWKGRTLALCPACYRDYEDEENRIAAKMGGDEKAGREMSPFQAKLDAAKDRQVAEAKSSRRTCLLGCLGTLVLTGLAAAGARWEWRAHQPRDLQREDAPPAIAPDPLPRSTPTAAVRDLPTPSAPAVAPPRRPPKTVAEAQIEAVRRHPSLGVKGSPLNARFNEIVKDYRQAHPEYFQRVDWPIRIADEAAMGGE